MAEHDAVRFTLFNAEGTPVRVRVHVRNSSGVLVALADEESRAASDGVAQRLRARGIPTEVAAAPQKFGKQIRYAERRGIPFVWFPASDGAADQVKDIRSGEQVDAAADTWEPPASDLNPTIVSHRPEELS